MNYLIWTLLGVVIATIIGTGPRRRAYRPSNSSAAFAGAFGALIGGVIGDGVPHAFSGAITVTSLIGAAIGALIFSWAVRDHPEDAGS